MVIVFGKRLWVFLLNVVENLYESLDGTVHIVRCQGWRQLIGFLEFCQHFRDWTRAEVGERLIFWSGSCHIKHLRCGFIELLLSGVYGLRRCVINRSGRLRSSYRLKIFFIGHESRGDHEVVLRRRRRWVNDDFLIVIRRRVVGVFGGGWLRFSRRCDNRAGGRIFNWLDGRYQLVLNLGNDFRVEAGKKILMLIFKYLQFQNDWVECGTKSILQVIVGGWGSVVLCWVHWKKFIFIQWLHFFTRVLVVCNTRG